MLDDSSWAESLRESSIINDGERNEKQNMTILKSIIQKILNRAVITEKEKISNAVYRIQIKSESIKNMDFTPGHFIRLAVGINDDEATKKDMVRSYSIWDMDKKKGTMELAVATHSNGVGAKWAKNCGIGDIIHFKSKKGKFLVDNSADSYLMIGDLSTLSHLYMINRHLSKDKKVESLIYNENIGELYPDIDANSPLSFYELERNHQDAIMALIRNKLPKMSGRKMVYIAGDSRVCVALNQYFRKELNWDPKQIKTKPFWNPEKKGLE